MTEFKKSQKRHEKGLADEIPEGFEPADTRSSQEDLVLRADQKNRVSRMAQELPRQQRNIVMATLDNLTNEQIAETLGVTESTVKAAKSKATKQLKNRNVE